ncbi:hypothetical protein [Thermococcus sp.]|uniref:hypothetical protein n=1 Tax=Thermococcus sp. TaxID=35749 RepID=UPI0026135632|nr:hypothetical protein [Thermococcus sp.]
MREILIWGSFMQWDSSVIAMAPDDFLVEGLSELLSLAGFTEKDREYKRKGNVRLVLIRGERENPFHGREVLTVGILRGRADAGWLQSVLKDYKKAGQVILVAIDGINGNVEGVKAADGKWLAEVFNRYSIEPPKTLLEKLVPERRQENKKLKEFVLDGPLIEELSPQKLIEEAGRILSYKYGLNPEEAKLRELKVVLRPIYVVVWTDGSESGKALVMGDRVELNAEGELKGLAMKVLLEDVSSVAATSLEVEETPDPLRLVTEKAARKGILNLRILQKRRAYSPSSAVLVFGTGINEFKVSFDFSVGRVWAEAEQLSEETLLSIVKERIEREVGEAPVSMEIRRRGRFTLIRGRTKRYLFEIEVNSYSGSVRRKAIALTEEAILDIVLKEHPTGRILGMERHPGAFFVDVLTDRGIVTVKLDPLTGETLMEEELKSPYAVLNNVVGDILRAGGDVELKTCQVIDHELVRAEFEGQEMRISILYDGKSGKVLEKDVEIGKKVAVKVALSRYPGFTPVIAEDSGNGFSITLEGDKHVVKLSVSRDGRVKEADRFLKREVAERIALEKVREVERNPVIEGLRLSNHWVVEFTGPRAFGKVVVHRRSGEVIAFEYQYVESAIAKAFTEFIRKQYGDTVYVEWVAHSIENGYAGIKGTGKKGTYFAKFNTLTGELIEHDFIPDGGIVSKLKAARVEGKYALR